MSETWIRVSDISEYVYCRRAWWLRRVLGEESRHAAELALGDAFHADHGRRVGRSIRLRRLALAALLLAIAVIATALIS